MHHPVTTISQLTTLKHETLIYAVVVMAVALLVSFVITTFLIPYKGGKDNSYIARRVVFILCCVVSALAFWVYNQTVVMATIRNAGFQSQFGSTNLLCLLITVVGYLLFGFLIALIFKKSKFATVFFKHKK